MNLLIQVVWFCRCSGYPVLQVGLQQEEGFSSLGMRHTSILQAHDKKALSKVWTPNT